MDETDVRPLLFIYIFIVEAMNSKRHWVKGKLDHVVQISICRLALT